MRLALGRNKEANLPAERVLLDTGTIVQGEDELNAFRAECESAAAGIDLAEIWELTVGEPCPLSLTDISELYWTETETIIQLSALLFHLETDDPYFKVGADGYTPKPEAEVDAILRHRRVQAARMREFDFLVTSLTSGETPSQPSRYHRELLDHLRGFVIHGDSYTRAASARELASRVSPGSNDHRREAFYLLVQAGLMSEDEPLEVIGAEIQNEFSDEVLSLAANVNIEAAVSESFRVDLTGMPTLTIDNADTADRDDAISLERLNGRLRLGIHIADAASLIEPGGGLFAEASRRSASLYLPEGTIPMLPPSVSESAGSLDPGVRRPALSVLADVTEDGEVLEWEIVPSVVRSDAALSYDAVDQRTADIPDEWREVIAALDRLSRGRARQRAQTGAVSLRRPEIEVSVDSEGVIRVGVTDRASMSRSLVSELMILCNCLMAKFCATNQIPAAFRRQAKSEESALPQQEDQAYDPVREFAAVRQLSPAQLSVEPGFHGGLGVAEYLQATAPLRRYSDLVMQHQIAHFIRSGAPLYAAEEVSAIAASADVQIRELARVERLRKRYWFLKFLLQTRIGQVGYRGPTDIFEAVVLERRKHGPSTIELVEYPFRTRIQLSDRDSPGDRVTLRLHDVDLWTRSAHFTRAS